MSLLFSYPTFLPPYLACLHSSNITCSLHCHDCPAELWNRFKEIGRKTCGGEQSKEVVTCIRLFMGSAFIDQQWLRLLESEREIYYVFSPEMGMILKMH